MTNGAQLFFIVKYVLVVINLGLMMVHVTMSNDGVVMVSNDWPGLMAIGCDILVMARHAGIILNTARLFFSWRS